MENQNYAPTSRKSSPHAEQRIVKQEILRKSVYNIMRNGSFSTECNGRFKYTYYDHVVITDPSSTTIITVFSSRCIIAKQEKEKKSDRKNKKSSKREKKKAIITRCREKKVIRRVRGRRHARARKYEYNAK
jgi:hypothetical protein